MESMIRLLLLKSAAINAPLLNDYRCTLSPLAIVERGDQIVNRMIDSLSLPTSAVSHIDYAFSLPDAKYVLNRHNFGVIFVYPEPRVERTMRSCCQQEKIEMILDTVSKGKVNAVVIFVFMEKIPEKYKNHLTYIRLQNIKAGFPILKQYPVPNPDQIQLALNSYRKLPNKVSGYEWLYGAVGMLYPFLLNERHSQYYIKIVHEMNKWVWEMELFKNDDMLLNWLIQSISDYLDGLDSDAIYIISDRVNISEDELVNKICIRGGYLFFTNDQLETALSNDNTEEISLKCYLELLEDHEILCKDKKKAGFKVQMDYTDQAGNKCRPYRYRLHIDHLFKDGIPECLKNKIQKDDTFDELYDR